MDRNPNLAERLNLVLNGIKHTTQLSDLFFAERKVKGLVDSEDESFLLILNRFNNALDVLKNTQTSEFECIMADIASALDSISDLLYGGEGGWENVEFNRFIEDIRKAVVVNNKIKSHSNLINTALKDAEEALGEDTPESVEHALHFLDTINGKS